MLSPGIGLQQPLRVTFISFIPSTKTSFLSDCFFWDVPVFFSSFSVLSSFLEIILITADGVYLPAPNDIYNSSKSFNFNVSKIVSRCLFRVSVIGKSFFLRACSNNSDPFCKLASFSLLV